MFEPPPDLRLELPPDVSAPRQARQALHRLIGEDSSPSLLHTAELLTSEVVSNAIQAGSGCSVAMWYVPDAGEGALRVEVADTAQEFPQLPRRPSAATTTSVRRRGLGLVDHLSTRWGVTIEHDRKEVWFELCA